MSNITFFFLLIPILAIVLLMVNFIFATHSPYQEKNSAFECGFHSFLGQNRMQFNITFFIFGILFLLFDLEILLIYPFPLSAQFNSLYGLSIMLIFFLILTLGFAFELGKNALKIDSRQYDVNTVSYKSQLKLLESNIFKSILKGIIASLVVLLFFSLIAKIFIFHVENTPLRIFLLISVLILGIILKLYIRSLLNAENVDFETMSLKYKRIPKYGLPLGIFFILLSVVDLDIFIQELYADSPDPEELEITSSTSGNTDGNRNADTNTSRNKGKNANTNTNTGIDDEYVPDDLTMADFNATIAEINSRFVPGSAFKVAESNMRTSEEALLENPKSYSAQADSARAIRKFRDQRANIRESLFFLRDVNEYSNALTPQEKLNNEEQIRNTIERINECSKGFKTNKFETYE